MNPLDFLFGTFQQLARRVALLLMLSVPVCFTFVGEVGGWFDLFDTFRDGAVRRTLISLEQVQRINRYLGLEHGPVGGYLTWLTGEDWLDNIGRMDLQSRPCQLDAAQCAKGVLRHDFGESWSVARGQNVTDVWNSRIRNSAILIAATGLLSILVALPVGLCLAFRQRHHATSACSRAPVQNHLPLFWFGMVLIFSFGGSQSLWHKLTGLPFLPTGNVMLVREPLAGSLHAALGVTPGSGFDLLLHLLLPMVCLSILPIVQWSGPLRDELLQVFHQEYIRTARAKGLTEQAILVRHVLRNAWFPYIGSVSRTVPGLVGALIITEVVFNWMGIGQLYIRALGAWDMPVTVAFLLLTTQMVTTPAFVQDALNFWIVPRELGLTTVS